jgi:plastocyanin
MQAGDDYQLRFRVVGTFHYVCTFHAPGMAGTVVVTR